MQTTCAYMGHATHHSAVVGGRIVPDIAWSYEDPLSDAGQVKGLVSFYQERLDLFVDGDPVVRPRTPWSVKRCSQRDDAVVELQPGDPNSCTA